jgi:tRNA1Val (adenine37-N6)-methyltransferase
MPRNHTFTFKQFSINQDRSAMKVCTDAVFFGAVIDPAEAKNILDIGTGTGLLALMMAQRSEASIVGIDIDPAAVQQAKENVLASKFKDRIEVFEAPVQQYDGQLFDFIISNPPFFQNSLLSSKKTLNLAHHAQTLKLAELLEAVARLLKKEGRFAVLLPTFEFEQFNVLASKIDLNLDSKYILKSSVSKPIFRIVGTFSFKKTSTVSEKTIAIYEEDLKTYTPDFQALIAEFYL